MKKVKLCFSIILMVLSVSACKEKKETPNILFIVIDDMNDWVGVFGGNPQTLTPNLDEFANHAVIFQNANCPGPVCGPSRSALLSGFMPYTSGVYNNSQNMRDSKLVQEHATLPEYFSKHGYLTISKGKIFHKHTTKNGWDHGQWAYDIWEHENGSGDIQRDKMFSRNEGIFNGVKDQDAKYTTRGVEFGWAPTAGKKEDTKDYRTAQWFAEKLNDDYEKPFFMLMGLSKPHLPWYVPEEYFEMYNLDEVKIPEYRLDDLDDILDRNGDKVFEPSDDFIWVRQDEELFRRAVRAYMAASSYADDCVGVVLDALAKSKYNDNTIVVIFGDHGWHLGEKLKFRKATLWKEATQLPLMIKTPEMSEKQYCTRTVNLIDLYPTLIDLCGIPEKTNIEGKSLVPLLNDVNLPWKPTTTSKAQGWNSVISEDWHYIFNSNDGTEELYDLRNDPMEWTNLVRSESKEIKEVLFYMKSYLPEEQAAPIPKSFKDKSIKIVDETIKETRDIDKLK